MHMSWWVFFPNRRYKLEGTSCRCRWGSSHDISLNCSQTTHRRFARTENAMMPCISSHQIRSSVPGFHSDGLLIWSYKYLRNIISPCFQPRGQRCVTKVKVLLYTLDAKAAEGSCSSIVTVPDISGEAWVAHLPDKTLRNNRDSSGETNQKKKRQHQIRQMSMLGTCVMFQAFSPDSYWSWEFCIQEISRNPSKILGFVSLPHSNLLR